MTSTRARWMRFGNLSLSWKLLLPSIGLIVVLGIVGGFLVVRDLSVRSQAALDLELSRRALEVRAALRDTELSLVEAGNFAANVEGIAGAVRSNEPSEVARLLESVVALKSDLPVLVATSKDGTPIVSFSRTGPSGAPERRLSGPSWSGLPFVRRALSDESGRKHSGLASSGDRTLLAVAAPICSARHTCEPVGTAIAATFMGDFAVRVLARIESFGRSRTGLAFFDSSGNRVAVAGQLGPLRVNARRGSEPTGAHERLGSVAVATLYVPFDVSDARLGTFAIAIPEDATLAAARRTGIGLGLILLAAMGGIAVLGVLLSRLTLRRVRALVATNRALGRGDLAARAHVDWNDEIGELGTRLNEMAEQLQAMYESLESRVAQRTEEIERLLRERTEFFASVSHELRTPLAVILRHAEMLLDSAYRKDGRWRTEAGNALRDSGGQLSHLIDDILELAEIEASSLHVDLQTIDLRAFLRGLRTTVEPLARASGVKATVSAPADGCRVLADPRRLRQILLNLVDNAVKYTPDGGSVHVSVECGDDHVRVSVADTGIGVPPEAGERIFEPFFRAKGAQTQRGQSSSGLGLAVARRLVEAHGGSIGYSARESGGTTFTFSLLRPGAEGALVGATEDRRDGNGKP